MCTFLQLLLWKLCRLGVSIECLEKHHWNQGDRGMVVQSSGINILLAKEKKIGPSERNRIHSINQPPIYSQITHIMCKKMDLIKVGSKYDGNVIFTNISLSRCFCNVNAFNCCHETHFSHCVTGTIGHRTHFNKDIKIMKILSFPSHCERPLKRFLKILQS